MIGAPPLISEISRPWWEALARHALALPRCTACAHWIFYPRPFCPRCGSRENTWLQVDGSATLYTYSVAELPVSPLFAHLDRPILAIAELSVGVRVPTTIIGAVHDVLAIGVRLEPVFDAETYAGVTLLRYRLA